MFTVVIPTIITNQKLLDQAIFQVRWTAPDAEILVPSGGTFAVNCNEGARLATTGTVIFLNDDTETQPGWYQPLLKALETHTVAGSRLTYPDGRIQHAGIGFTWDGATLHGINLTEDGPSREVDAVTGACLAIRRDKFLTLGGFDTGYRNGNEDVDLCLRIRATGGTVWYCADSHVVHHESASGPARWAHTAENVARLNELWTTRPART